MRWGGVNKRSYTGEVGEMEDVGCWFTRHSEGRLYGTGHFLERKEKEKPG